MSVKIHTKFEIRPKLGAKVGDSKLLKKYMQSTFVIRFKFKSFSLFLRFNDLDFVGRMHVRST